MAPPLITYLAESAVLAAIRTQTAEVGITFAK
jgi:hypothetical protein